MADDALLLPLRSEACAERTLQSVAEARVHLCGGSGRPRRPDRDGAVQSRAILAARDADGRVSSRAIVAFRRDGGVPVLHRRSSDYGCAARMEELRLDADRMEARARVPYLAGKRS